VKLISNVSDIRVIYKNNPNLFTGLKNPAEFYAWLRAGNLHIVVAFQKYAIMLRKDGNRKHYGSFAIINKLRWDSYFREVGSEYKISNNTAPYLARLIMAANPELDGMFRVKSSVL
jgi:hypothetical protein